MVSETLTSKILHETATYPWRDLLKNFAAGQVIFVDAQLDLIEVGAAIAEDKTELVKAWMEVGQVAKVSDAQAQLWLEQDLELWTVVIRPWILVQEKRTNKT